MTRLDPVRLATLEALVDRLLPADELGPGAREAGVAGYIDGALAGAYGEQASAYEVALDAIAAHAVTTLGLPFAELGPAEQDDVVTALERGAISGADGEEPFFELVRRHVIEGMFGDPRWGGNAGGLGWQLLGYPGPRLVWTDADQQLA